MTDRRTFLRGAAALLPTMWVAPACLWNHSSRTTEASADLIIIGGGLGGSAAALARSLEGRHVKGCPGTQPKASTSKAALAHTNATGSAEPEVGNATGPGTAGATGTAGVRCRRRRSRFKLYRRY